MGLDLSAHQEQARPSRGRHVRLLRAAAVVLGVTFLLTGCSKEDTSQLGRLALPVGASNRTGAMFALWLGAWIAVLVVFVLVFGLIVWSMIRYRRRSDDEIPSQIRYNLPIEVLYTIAPVIVVAVFFFHTVEAQNTMLRKVDNPDHTIAVIGSKWQWTFNYLNEQATGQEPVFDDGDTNDPTELWLPVGQSVRFDLHSPDVIHSFWIPEFYFKMDVIPGKTNSFDLTPTRKGVYTGRCAELCGMYHSRMLFKVHIVSPAEYDAHLVGLKNAGQVGKPRGGSDAYEIAGLAKAKARQDAENGAGK